MTSWCTFARKWLWVTLTLAGAANALSQKYREGSWESPEERDAVALRKDRSKSFTPLPFFNLHCVNFISFIQESKRNLS
jgi:hypothetical protein